MERIEAIRKLVDTFHLNIEERKVFSNIPLTIEEVVLNISHLLTKNKTYPSSWSADDNYDGVLLELREDDIIGTHKAEISLMQYKIIEQQSFSEPELAARYAAKKMFGDEIDGIEVIC